jgi:2-polyprenyl-3-methyl-5-hydroxy-6-metoxy-1,4-benzoquinol methylase
MHITFNQRLLGFSQSPSRLANPSPDCINPWNTLAGIFNTHTDDIDPGAADNILIGWPALFRGIEKKQVTGKGLAALDFGCGTGGLCAELETRGYTTTGYDTAVKMIEVAKANVSGVNFFDGGSNLKAHADKRFDLITSMMVLQFIKDLEETLHSLCLMLNPSGILAFAVFNPAYVLTNHGEAKPFQDFTEEENFSVGSMCPTNDARIPVFIRSEQDYDALLRPFGVTRIHMEKPPFNEEFLKKFPKRTSTDESEYLVLVYLKEKSSKISDGGVNE